MQFLVAAVAFILVGVILAQIIGSGEDGDSDSATGVDPIATPTNELVVLDATATLTPSVQPTRSTETASTEPTPTTEPMATATEASTVPVLPTHQQVPTFDPLISSLVIAPDYATCGDTVMAYGSNFKPGTTITIYGGGLLGDVFAPVVDEHPVADDGSFAVQLDLSRVFDVCGGGSETPNGTQFRLGAETGSSLTKSDFNADDPRAIAVLTYSDDTPVGVADRVRLPSCGTEVILNGNMLRDQGQPDVTARECFAEAVAAGALAEFISHQQTVEGDVVTTIYNSLGNGDVDVIIDGSRDQFGSGEWQRSTCVWSEMSNLEPYSFHYEYCSEPVVIE
jgi:hypothetical protein